MVLFVLSACLCCYLTKGLKLVILVGEPEFKVVSIDSDCEPVTRHSLLSNRWVPSPYVGYFYNRVSRYNCNWCILENQISSIYSNSNLMLQTIVYHSEDIFDVMWFFRNCFDF